MNNLSHQSGFVLSAAAAVVSSSPIFLYLPSPPSPPSPPFPCASHSKHHHFKIYISTFYRFHTICTWGVWGERLEQLVTRALTVTNCGLSIIHISLHPIHDGLSHGCWRLRDGGNVWTAGDTGPLLCCAWLPPWPWHRGSVQNLHKRYGDRGQPPPPPPTLRLPGIYIVLGVSLVKTLRNSAARTRLSAAIKNKNS